MIFNILRNEAMKCNETEAAIPEVKVVQDDVVREITDALLEQLPIGVILADTEGMMVYVNQTAEKIRKVNRNDLLGQDIRDCHKTESREKVIRAIDNILSKPETKYKRMIEDAANGKFFINTYAGILNQTGQAIGLAILTEDVTEKRKLELDRATAYRMMQETADSLKSRYHDLLVLSLESINKMLEKRDAYTGNHSANVCRYALKLYEQRYGVGIEYDTLKTAANLHDIGKIGIPDDVLKKPGRLTKQEFDIIKKHVTIAEDILRPLDAGSEISRIVRHHHEHYDGSGYPDGLRGEEIPMLSRIIAIADAFDAMLSDRPYRSAMQYQACIDEMIRQSGKQFDPDWISTLLDLANTGGL